jgi:hypothetical protein
MGTSWNKRHNHEEPARKAADRKAYAAWKAQFANSSGKWDESKVQKWLKKRRAARKQKN